MDDVNKKAVEFILYELIGDDWDSLYAVVAPMSSYLHTPSPEAANLLRFSHYELPNVYNPTPLFDKAAFMASSLCNTIYNYLTSFTNIGEDCELKVFKPRDKNDIQLPEYVLTPEFFSNRKKQLLIDYVTMLMHIARPEFNLSYSCVVLNATIIFKLIVNGLKGSYVYTMDTMAPYKHPRPHDVGFGMVTYLDPRINEKGYLDYLFVKNFRHLMNIVTNMGPRKGLMGLLMDDEVSHLGSITINLCANIMKNISDISGLPLELYTFSIEKPLLESVDFSKSITDMVGDRDIFIKKIDGVRTSMITCITMYTILSNCEYIRNIGEPFYCKDMGTFDTLYKYTLSMLYERFSNLGSKKEDCHELNNCIYTHTHAAYITFGKFMYDKNVINEFFMNTLMFPFEYDLTPEKYGEDLCNKVNAYKRVRDAVDEMSGIDGIRIRGAGTNSDPIIIEGDPDIAREFLSRAMGTPIEDIHLNGMHITDRDDSDDLFDPNMGYPDDDLDGEEWKRGLDL